MNCLIITPFISRPLGEIIGKRKFDIVMCADASDEIARKAGLCPNVIIGDFDHGDLPQGDNITRVPCEKDDTDTMLCIKRALSLGADDIFIAGGVGGRLDHTIANIQSIAYAEKNGAHAVLSDGDNEAFLITKNAKVPRRDGYYFSLFSYGDECRGVSASGVKYRIRKGTLDFSFPLGVSNEITADYAEISVESGTLLAIFSKKEQK